jgi:XTP/dITP diphosphohydrolase
MQPLLYATGNVDKFRQARHVCQPAGIQLIQDSLEVPEIQGEDVELIARDKAHKAYAKFQKPVLISDDSWAIHGLNGFPGPYMKSVSTWFTLQDWLNLTSSLNDRQVTLCQIVVFQDSTQQKLFSCEVSGLLLTEARGKSSNPYDSIISFDNGANSVAEMHSLDKSAIGHLPSVWHGFIEWHSSAHG